MRSIEPPKIAACLLRYFGSSPHNESIIGDLQERYRGSRLWYWRQALLAIVLSFFKEVSAHKLIAIRALLFGWMVKAAWLWFIPIAFMVGPTNSQRFRSLLLVSAAGSIAVCALSAWLVSRSSGPHYRPMVLLYVIVELLAVPVMLAVGWYSPFAFPAVLLGAPADSALWAAPFAAYCAIALSSVGYPFESVIAVWCGSILMAVTILLGGRASKQDSLENADIFEPTVARNLTHCRLLDEIVSFVGERRR